MTATLVNEKGAFDKKAAENFVRHENKFITDLLKLIRFPDRKDAFDDDDNDDGDEEREPDDDRVQPMKFEGTKPRAKSLLELRQRLAAVTGKKRLTYKEKLKKKGLKNRLKKKTQKDEKNAERKVKKAQEGKMEKQEDDEVKREDGEVKAKVFNKEDKMVFSKIDFSDVGKKKKAKQEKDPKKLLKRIEVFNEKVQKLTESGKIEEAVQIKEKTAWMNALAKAQGQKIKDDPILLKKSLKKKEQKQRASKKKWEQRLKNVEKAKDERQQKRKQNIDKRKKEVKTKKMKKAVKKGKVIPGY